MCPPSASEGIQKRVVVESTKSKEVLPLVSSLAQIAALARSLLSDSHSKRSRSRKQRAPRFAG
ncbi:MAG: hypothetical protein F6J93_28215 [Oscillatoria sp. SIO1A7]|nr:hypothetical protein [Oscillatoria sp. SIO1A7]